MGLFTDKMRKYILGETKNGYSEEIQKVYDKRVLEYAIDGLQDLALIAERLPEKQQQKVFNKKTLSPLLRSVFTLKIRPEMSEEEIEIRRNRILELSYDLLMYLGEMTNAYGLAKEQMRILTMAGSNNSLGCIQGLTAILIKSMSHE